jgi:diguanylate cyclase (GGDEF)-like protein
MDPVPVIAQEELASRLDAVQRQLEELTAEVARNDAKMRRSQQRELRLLEAEDLESLLHELIDGLRISYGLHQVSLVFCDPDHDVRHLLLAAGTPAESFPGLLIKESLSGVAPQYVALHEPWLGAFAACDHQLLFPDPEGLASIAMIPLRHRGKLIGSINLGSEDRMRFTRAHASDFLAHLGLIASYCVENVINRARLLRSGFTDVLTGWNNRRYLAVRMAEELARARRDRSRLVCLMLDIDHFKRVNDTWGHAAGDAVLREFAQRIEAEVRASDVAARFGGEEFVVLMPATEVASASLLAERIRHAVAGESVQMPNGEAVSITVSIGVASATPSPTSADLKTVGDSLLARADVALYRAKSEGRNRIATEED